MPDCSYWIILAVLIGAGLIKQRPPRGGAEQLPPGDQKGDG